MKVVLFCYIYKSVRYKNGGGKIVGFLLYLCSVMFNLKERIAESSMDGEQTVKG